MVYRERFEKEYRSLYEKYGYGTTVWSPLAQGFLSGRYNDGNIPEDSRMNKWDPFMAASIHQMYLAGGKKEKLIKICQATAEVAKELGYSQAQLALAWALVSKDVSTILIGFSRLEQLDENIKALELAKKWNKEIEEKAEAALGNQPELKINFKSFTPFPQRRQVAVLGRTEFQR